MELKQIQYFELIYKHKSISKAASELYMSQQGVSKQIASLEAELNAPLFRRTSRGVELTEEGQYFHEQAAIIQRVQQNITDHFASISAQRQQSLKISVSRGLNVYFGNQFFDRFSEKHPEVSLSIYSLWNPITDDSVLKDAIDLGFTLAPVQVEGLQLESVLRAPLCCIVNVNNPLAEKESLDWDDILSCTVAMADENYNSHRSFSELCAARNAQPKTVEMFDLLSIYDYVKQRTDTVGFTLSIYRSFLNYPNLKYLPINDEQVAWDICIARKKGKCRRIVQDFVNFTREYIVEQKWDQ